MTGQGDQDDLTAPAALPEEARPVSLRLFGRPFAFVWTLRGLSVLGTQLISFALSLQLYQLTGSLLDLGLLGLIQFFPTICFALPAGQLIDRFPPGRIAACTQAVNAVAVILLLAPGLTGLSPMAGLFTVALITGATRAFEHPVNTALTPLMVERRHVPAAVAWTMSVAKIGGLAGPVAAGALYAIRPDLSYAVALALCLAAGATALALPEPTGRPVGEPLSLRSAFTGFSVIWRDRVLSGAMVLDLVAVLLGGATALLPAFALDILHIDAVGLGILRAAPGLGAIAIGLWLARHPVSRRAGPVLIVTTCVFGFLTCGFALSQSFLLSCVLLAGIGAADMVSIHIRSALVQLRTPVGMRGRVGAVNGIFISSSNQIGAFESGLVASWLGLVPAVVVGGAGTVLATCLAALVFRQLRTVDAPDS